MSETPSSLKRSDGHVPITNYESALLIAKRNALNSIIKNCNEQIPKIDENIKTLNKYFADLQNINLDDNNIKSLNSKFSKEIQTKYSTLEQFKIYFTKQIGIANSIKQETLYKLDTSYNKLLNDELKKINNNPKYKKAYEGITSIIKNIDILIKGEYIENIKLINSILNSKFINIINLTGDEKIIIPQIKFEEIDEKCNDHLDKVKKIYDTINSFKIPPKYQVISKLELSKLDLSKTSMQLDTETNITKRTAELDKLIEDIKKLGEDIEKEKTKIPKESFKKRMTDAVKRTNPFKGKYENDSEQYNDYDSEDQYYYAKYLKYKAKYIELKKLKDNS